MLSVDVLVKYVVERGGKWVICKVLIVNNGMVVMKSIFLMWCWAFNTFGDENVI